jgi:glucokinase
VKAGTDPARAQPATVLAFDLGGTRLKFGVADADGSVRDVTAVALGGIPALEVLLDTARALRLRHPCVAAGLAMPGVIDAGRSISLPGKLPGLEGTDLSAVLGTALEVPVAVINDAQAYAIGEAATGSARGVHRAVIVTIGTGVGVGVVEDGLPLGSGPHGGGTFGSHIPVAGDSDGTDSNGRRGTIEALCSAPRLLDGTGGVFTTVEAVVDAARLGDPLAGAAVAHWRADLVTALVALAHAHGPDVVVVGGGPLSSDGFLLDGVEERVNARLFRSYSVSVRRAALGDAAALVGVALLARRALGGS